MAIQITDNTDTIDISFDGNADLRCIHKTNCSLERSGEYVSIFDSGITPPKEYVIKYDEVTNYSFTDGADFFHQINAILNNKYATANVVDGVELNNSTTTKIIDEMIIRAIVFPVVKTLLINILATECAAKNRPIATDAANKKPDITLIGLVLHSKVKFLMSTPI